MTLVSGSVPNLVNGISQQPYSVRLASQGEIQENALSSPVDGLGKRPPTIHKAVINGVSWDDAFTHIINRDSTEQYYVIIANGDLRVFDLQGNEKVVNFPHGKGYLAGSNPSERFRAVSVADFTFIVNRSVTVQEDPYTIPSRPFEGLVWVRQGNYSSTYTVNVTGGSATKTTLDGSNASHGADIKTDKIATDLATQLQNISGYTVVRSGSVIHITRSSDFSFTVTDSIGDTALVRIKDYVQSFSDLPAKNAPTGFKVAIRGNATNAFDDYWVEFDGAVWKEAAKPGERNRFLRSTMPHVLVRESDGSFTFRQGDWADREVGSKEKVTFPSFVGRKINDVFFFRNRLGFLSDEAMILSRTGFPFNFWRESAIQILDTDPIDVGASHVKVSILQHAIPWNETLLLFSGQTQFILNSVEVLTPRSAGFNVSTEFECSLQAKPVAVGTNVYFAVNRGAYTAIREYYMDGDTQAADAVDVTAHCPKYLPSNIIKLTASPNEETVVALSADERSALYVYKYYFDGLDKIQSSWSKWTFNGSILNMEFIESDLILLIQRSDGAYIEIMPVQPGRVDLLAQSPCLLDRRVTNEQMTLSYNAATNRTAISVPNYTAANSDIPNFEVVTWADGVSVEKPGTILPIVAHDNSGSQTIFYVRGDHRTTRMYLGRKYLMRYRFSPFFIREEAVGGGLESINSGRLQIRRLDIVTGPSGYFKVLVIPEKRSTYEYIFNGTRIGTATIGEINLEETKFNVPVRARNTEVAVEVHNDSFLPCQLLNAEWEGFYQRRSRRL